MPTISQFYGISIRMYFDDHPPPHFHAYYGNEAAKIEIATLRITEGKLRRRPLALVLEWAVEHREQLLENGELAEAHRTLNPIAPLELRVMQRVVKVSPLADYRLAVRFDDGTEGEIALGERLFGPVFESLHDVKLFGQVFVDEFGAIAWPNGADLAPDAIYEQLSATTSAASQN